MDINDEDRVMTKPVGLLIIKHDMLSSIHCGWREASLPWRQRYQCPAAANPRLRDMKLELETFPTSIFHTCATSKLEAIWQPIEDLESYAGILA